MNVLTPGFGVRPRRLLLLLVVGCSLTLLQVAQAAPSRTELTGLDIHASPHVWLLEIPHSGNWSHWPMAEPPRLVFDLQNATSRLAEAPGLLSVDLPSGPVELLRTSQFSNDPQNRVVRVTLVLTGGSRYDTEQRNGIVRVRISAPDGVSWPESWQLHLDQAGVHFHDGDWQPEAESTAAGEAVTPEPDPPADATATATEPVDQAGSEQTAPEGDPVTERLAAPAQLVKADPPAPPMEEATLESLLADSTLFIRGTPHRPQSAWDMAAARLLEDGQELYVAGDTTGCIDRLRTCERFYADTNAGGQATLLCTIVLRVLGREVEAGMGARVPTAGPWPLLTDEMMATLFAQAQIQQDLALSDHILRVWREAEPLPSVWARGALRMGEIYLDAGRASAAADWVAMALDANPELEVSARALFLHAQARLESQQWDEADLLLERLEPRAEGALYCRTRALRADLRYRTGRLDEAARIYEELVADDVPAVEREWALYQLGNCWAALGESGRAMTYLNRIAGEDSESFWAPFARMRLSELGGESRVATSQ